MDENQERIKEMENLGQPSETIRPLMATLEEKGTFLIQRQNDGNYRGWTKKDGKLIEVRDVGPETVLQLLLTHDGT